MAKTQSRPERLLFKDQAYREIKRRILENEMPAGYQVMEQEMAEALGMSRTPVREAFIQLANEGLVEVRPRHGMKVLPVSAEDMDEIYQILTGLESMAAEEVARNGLSSDQVGQLTEAVEEMEQALARQDLGEWARADENFHKLLVHFSGNERLMRLVEKFWDQAHRVRLLTLKLRPLPTQSNSDHRETLEAIINQNVDAARETHRMHRVRARETLVNLLRSHGLTQL